VAAPQHCTARWSKSQQFPSSFLQTLFALGRNN
jgi:hypothetical protein